MGEQCSECGASPIYGYTEHGNPLCSMDFEKYIEDVQWANEYGLEDALMEAEEEGREEC